MVVCLNIQWRGGRNIVGTSPLWCLQRPDDGSLDMCPAALEGRGHLPRRTQHRFNTSVGCRPLPPGSAGRPGLAFRHKGFLKASLQCPSGGESVWLEMHPVYSLSLSLSLVDNGHCWNLLFTTSRVDFAGICSIMGKPATLFFFELKTISKMLHWWSEC